MKHLSTVATLFTCSLLCSLLAACNSGNFAGATARTTGEKAPPKSQDAKPAEGTKPAGTRSGDDPSGSDKANGKAGDGKAGDANNGANDRGDGQGSSGDDANSKIGETSDDKVSQIDDQEIEFGGDKTFRLGDGQASASSCLSTLQSYDVSGTKYYFDFSVTQNETTIAVQIRTICGVDHDDTNFASLQQGSSKIIEPTKLASDSDQFALPAVKLAKGKYRFVVESRPRELDGGQFDSDDYIIGKINVKVVSGGGKIIPGSVTTE